ncbi:bifunctional pyr operon transcriptional regulator/uracil phosphoribosyltransferase PyrR [Ferrimicrobium acidiphilum]|uniref:Bifunctional protein PyrR n=1 Tax=Ferrimicrobium acidiphilum DSM 19497 TaxID=1121877 RepID=A0A0D8FSU6_9ACTN|nr:bifunctional pyr operon transcriptional regulator/uracil phosphoribosyltransferase PyrR [Ferrimicrobium acidiphilum]KJE76348.1 bifunctional protein PyrR [Ferrimicrobium acidiphilum DSM 19497]
MARSSTVLDEAEVERMIARMAHEILERLQRVQSLKSNPLSVIGIRSGGVWLGRRLCERLVEYAKLEIAFSEVSISSFRDDRPRTAVVDAVGIDQRLPVEQGVVILVDDVIQSGRTARAALEAILSSYRPELIQLAVLVDRGHRELPICPDYVGKNLPSALSEYVAVTPHGVTIHRA